MNLTLIVQWYQTLTRSFKYVMVSSKVEFCLTSYLQHILTVCLVNWCRLFVGALVYTNDVTMITTRFSNVSACGLHGMDTMLKFMSVLCILVVPYPHVVEYTLWS